MKARIIDIDLYKCRLTIFRGGSYKEIEQWLNEYYGTDDDGEEIVRALSTQFDEVISKQSCGAFIWYDREFFVWLPAPSGTPELIHELYHATNYILTQCGVKHDEQDEPYAYLLEYLTRQALKKPTAVPKLPTATEKNAQMDANS